MPASKEISLKQSGKVLGIIAGGGAVPRRLQTFCDEHGIPYKIVGFKKFTNQVEPNFWTHLGRSGKTIDWLKRQDITDLVMIGSIQRPTLWDIWPDMVTLKVLFNAWWCSFGDSGLLSSVRDQLEKMGFTLHGIHHFLPDLLFSSGALGELKPTDDQHSDIDLGIQESQKLGKQDIGQAVIIKDGCVIAREDKHGTSAMIKRFGCTGSILVKTCKPQQDQDLDLPTIGSKTLEQCAGKKMLGVVGHAGKSILVDRDRTIEVANQNGLFLYGVVIDE